MRPQRLDRRKAARGEFYLLPEADKIRIKFYLRREEMWSPHVKINSTQLEFADSYLHVDREETEIETVVFGMPSGSPAISSRGECR